jgi:ATP-dependent DNA ligase
LKNLEKSLKKAIEKEYEGIILKKLNSPYLISDQAPIATHYWRKLKG